MPTFNPNISQLKRRAKELTRDVHAGEAEAVSRARAHLPDTASTSPDAFGLRDAQFVIAREEGFEGWSQLIEVVGEQLINENDLHRWFGVHLNNTTWGLMDKGTTTSESAELDRETFLYGAYAAAYHWMQVGSPINQARAEHLIARVAIRVGRFDTALHHATRCLELVEQHPELAEDWDLGFALEALARAHAANGSTTEARAIRARAESVVAGIKDPQDAAVVQGELDSGAWFGV